MIKRITAYILLGLGAIVFIFFREYKGKMIALPGIYMGLGLMLSLAGGYILIRQKRSKRQRAYTLLVAATEELKSNGMRVTVHLDQCEIRENNYREARELPEQNYFVEEYGIWPDLLSSNAFSDAATNEQNVTVHQTVFIFNYDIGTGLKRFVSPVLPFDRTTLLFKLGRQTETTLYIDRSNSNMYYFDLEFLLASS